MWPHTYRNHDVYITSIHILSTYIYINTYVYLSIHTHIYTCISITYTQCSDRYVTTVGSHEQIFSRDTRVPSTRHGFRTHAAVNLRLKLWALGMGP